MGTLAAAGDNARPGTPSPGVAAALQGAPSAAQPEASVVRAGRLRRSLRAAMVEGLLAEVITACAGGAILTGWAIYLEASPLVAGLLVALPQMAQLFQIPAAWTTSFLGHRRACIALVGASRQTLLPLAALPLLPVSPHTKNVIFLCVAASSAVLGVLGNNAWVAWMGELVPRRVRGRYFGRRSALCMLGGAVSSAGAGWLLDAAAARGATGLALGGLQLFACAAGLVTVVLMRRQHDPAPRAPRAAMCVAHSLAPFRAPALRGLLRYQLAWQFGVGLSGSFYALHMLTNLKMGFRLVALHGTVFAASRMFTAPLWGRLLDRVGARPVLLLCSFGLAAVPFVWLWPTEASLWPLAFDAVFAGVLWCGHSLAAFNLPLSVTPRQGRPFYLAAISGVGGLAFTAATLLAGALAESLPARFALGGHSFFSLQVLFVISGAVRLGAAFCALRIREPAARGVPELLATLTASWWPWRRWLPAADASRGS